MVHVIADGNWFVPRVTSSEFRVGKRDKLPRFSKYSTTKVNSRAVSDL